VSKKQILSAIRVSARKLGRAPSSAELLEQTRVRSADIRRHFSGMYEAITAAGLTPRFHGPRNDTGSLLCDWARVARKLKRLPTGMDYQREGRYTSNTLQYRFRSWQLVPERFCAHARRWQLEQQWADVLEMIVRSREHATIMAQPECMAKPESRTSVPRAVLPPKTVFRDRPVQGASLLPRHHLVPGLLYEPTNEAGVLFVFAAMAHRLGFEVESIQKGFPDCEARRQIRPGLWQRVRIEFEFESRSFRAHGHDPKGCDIIVCWRHNWKKCPKNLEVIELGPMVRGGQLISL
jgi:hypothetical protein